MPKKTKYTLAWSPTQKAYQLSEALAHDVMPIVPDSPAWFLWLEGISCFAFVGQQGRYTARKETRPRGEGYWYAYQAQGTRLHKKYLGKTTHLTLTRLEMLAQILSSQHMDEHRQRRSSDSAQIIAAPHESDPRSPSVPLPLHAPLPSLLLTKLHLPYPRSPLVARPHLVERLHQGVQRPLTLLSAPAGFGKTTLLAQWLSHCRLPIAWLSLEPEDNDPTRFLSYLVAALQTLVPQMGTTVLALLNTPQPLPPEAVMARLVNDLEEHGDMNLVLVLDDYHVITEASLQRAMIFLLDHLPLSLHLIVATRTDPPWPLARRRASGRLSEVRALDLRFARHEICSFLQVVMGMDLPTEAMTILEDRTEGWIAGLQLAALSLQGRTDIAHFLADFAGTHRFVLDYLSEEVLNRQSPSVQMFLLSTSLLDRLSGPLCDAVIEQEESQEMLEMLEKANLFVVALDEVRGWYRYHHLFAEVLRSHLRQQSPTMIPVLHRRASMWCEHHGLPLEAVHHALAIPDEERAIRLIEPIVIPFAFRGQRSTVLGWLNALPEAVVRAHPLLCVYYSSLLLLTNQFDAAQVRLREAEVGSEKDIPAEQAQLIQGYILTNRSTIAFFSGDLSRAIPLAQQALDLLPETEDLARSGVLTNAAPEYLITGDVTHTTEQALLEKVAVVRTLHNPFATVSSIALLARLQMLQGRLSQAAATYDQIMQDISSPEVLQTRFAGPYYYFGLGNLLRERNDLAAAEQHLRQGMALLHEDVPLEAWVALQGYIAQAFLQHACGHAVMARSTLKTLAHIAQQRQYAAPLMAQVSAERVRLDLLQGNLKAAISWAETCRCAPEDVDVPYPRECEYLILARVRIAQKQHAATSVSLQPVLSLLNRLLVQAEAQERWGSVIEILIVSSLAQEAQGERALSRGMLERALLLAEPEGYVRLFVDEGPPMQALLHCVQARGFCAEYVITLLNSFGGQSSPSHSAHTESDRSLAEPLSQRERDVLALLLEGASNREIAHRLVLSVNTIKRHVYNLCSKLGVKSRTQAIIRARSLNLF